MNPKFYQSDRIALFVDGANLYQAARLYGFDTDFVKLMGVYQSKGTLVQSNFYTTFKEAEDFTPLKPLMDFLSFNGWNVTSKLLREFTDNSGARRYRGNINSEFVTDLFVLSPYIDHYVMFVGDGDYTYPVKNLQRMGKRVTIVSTLGGGGVAPTINDELRRAANFFVDIRDIQEQIQRDKR